MQDDIAYRLSIMENLPFITDSKVSLNKLMNLDVSGENEISLEYLKETYGIIVSTLSTKRGTLVSNSIKKHLTDYGVLLMEVPDDFQGIRIKVGRNYLDIPSK